MNLFQLPWNKDGADNFDPITGRPKDDYLYNQQASALKALQEEAAKVSTLEHNPGWKYVRTAIEVDCDIAQRTLLDSKSMPEVVEIQQFIKSRRSLLRWIDEKIQQANQLLEEQNKALAK